MKDYSKRINPIIRNLAEISSFSDIKDSPYISEYAYLKSLVQLISKDIKENQSSIESLQKLLKDLEFEIKSYVGADKSAASSDYGHTKKSIKRKIEQINQALEQISTPYFGKIVFERQADKVFPSGKITSYIGKHAYFDFELRSPIITDWRAPITDLYYSNSGPTKGVSFKSPAGEQFGNLLEKTQYEIAHGRITNVYNSQTGNAVADTFLLSQLSKKIGKKLTDIVSTIQDQQNKIIRDKVDAPMIIQGVAGSGKTTILLHRVAYLLYAYKESISGANSLIIGPNKMFLDFISEILPSLGVIAIEQNTYTMWAKSILKWDYRFILSDTPDNLKVKKFKGSPIFVKIVTNFLDSFETNLLENISDPMKEIIKSRYFDLQKSQPMLSLFERLDFSVQYAFAQQQFKYNMTGDFNGDIVARDIRQQKILNYFKKKTNVFELYKSIFKNAILFSNEGLAEAEFLEIQKHSMTTLTKTKGNCFFKVEDLAPILWIYFRIYGVKSKLKDYIAIDEAQDMSIFQILSLVKSAKMGNVSIAGDLAQSILPPFNIEDWQELIDSCKTTLGYDIKYHQLDKCYRTTVEIIDYANSRIKGKFPSSYKLPEAVLRHGEKVNEVNLQGFFFNDSITKKDLNHLLKILSDEEKKGAATIAIICKSLQHSDKVYEKLSLMRDRLAKKIYNFTEDDFHEGILILPVERAKGIEFDAVIMADYCKEMYSDSFLDSKLFYVAVTRALHRLHILR
jgi:DNA helicase-2/ATP-dependent DNA helicase PcrA